MPSFNASPFAALPEKATPGCPVYLFGTYNEKQAPTKFSVTKDQATSATAAVLTVQITEGNIPAVGSLLTTYGTTNTGGQFNFTNAVITAVSITASTGAGTISVTGSGLTTQAATADTGVGIIPVPETGDTVADGQSVAAGLPYTSPFSSDQPAQAVQCEVTFPTLPTACVVSLQAAMTLQAQSGGTVGAQWQTVISNVVTVAAGSATYGTTQWSGKANFLRFSISGTSGSGTIVAKVMI